MAVLVSGKFSTCVRGGGEAEANGGRREKESLKSRLGVEVG